MSFQFDEPFEEYIEEPTTAPPPKVRSLFWPGFTFGLVFTALVSCGGLAMALGLNDISLADIQGGGPAWTPPAITPTPENVVVQSAAAAPIAGIFQPGQNVRNITNSRVNIRRTPGHLGKPGDDILAQAQPGESVEIISGPTEADNLLWWQIRYGGTEGWVAEATSSGVTILGP
ncbi:MAG: SH3 domain-containing protein [Caldilineaceae bacterium]